jgi:hypothetical protein
MQHALYLLIFLFNKNKKMLLNKEGLSDFQMEEKYTNPLDPGQFLFLFGNSTIYQKLPNLLKLPYVKLGMVPSITNFMIFTEYFLSYYNQTKSQQNGHLQ